MRNLAKKLFCVVCAVALLMTGAVSGLQGIAADIQNGIPAADVGL